MCHLIKSIWQWRSSQEAIEMHMITERLSEWARAILILPTSTIWYQQSEICQDRWLRINNLTTLPWIYLGVIFLCIFSNFESRNRIQYWLLYLKFSERVASICENLSAFIPKSDGVTGRLNNRKNFCRPQEM